MYYKEHFFNVYNLIVLNCVFSLIYIYILKFVHSLGDNYPNLEDSVNK